MQEHASNKGFKCTSHVFRWAIQKKSIFISLQKHHFKRCSHCLLFWVKFQSINLEVLKNSKAHWELNIPLMTAFLWTSHHHHLDFYSIWKTRLTTASLVFKRSKSKTADSATTALCEVFIISAVYLPTEQFVTKQVGKGIAAGYSSAPHQSLTPLLKHNQISDLIL